MRCVLSSNRGSPERLRSVGIDGPKISVSRIPVRMPRRAKERARFTVGLEMSLTSNRDTKVHTSDSRFPYSSFRGGDSNDLLHIANLALLWQAAAATGKWRQGAGAREALCLIKSVSTNTDLGKQTSGLSCCRHRNVENNLRCTFILCES